MNLQELLLTKNISQRCCANLVNVTQPCISKWCNLKTKPPLEKMQKLADALNVDLVTIVDCFATKKDQG